jgi:hypothetical protein
VSDARALWVNPAGLGKEHEASIHADVTVEDPGSDIHLRQITLGFNSRGLSFGYQRDSFDGGVIGHTYRIGLGASRRGLSAGLASSIYRGDTKGTGWDFGVGYEPVPQISFATVVTNVMQPEVRGETQVATLVPSVALKPLGSLIVFSSEGRFTRDSVIGYAVDARISIGGRVPFSLLVRMDADPSFNRSAWVFGLSIGGKERVGSAVGVPQATNRVDQANLYGLIARTARR